MKDFHSDEEANPCKVILSCTPPLEMCSRQESTAQGMAGAWAPGGFRETREHFVFLSSPTPTLKTILVSHPLIQVILGIAGFPLGAPPVLRYHLTPLHKGPLLGEKFEAPCNLGAR